MGSLLKYKKRANGRRQKRRTGVRPGRKQFEQSNTLRSTPKTHAQRRSSADPNGSGTSNTAKSKRDKETSQAQLDPIFAQCGFGDLAGAGAVEAAVRKLGQALDDENADLLRRATVRSGAIKILKNSGVSEPKAVLDAADIGRRRCSTSESKKENVSQAELEELSQDLRHNQCLIERIRDAVTARGYAGDVRPVQLAYLVITSRLLDRPMNLVFVGDSAIGKNATVDAAIELHPAQAVYAVSAASPKAMVYIENEDFQHRMVFFKEADSIPEDGAAASIIRSLAADNVIRYDVTEQVTETDPETGRSKTRFKTRHIEIPGPTGLITTSTRSLRHQMNTRTLEDHLPDDPEQTRAVMRAHARSVNPPSGGPEVNLAPFVAFQEWLERFGEHRVAVPFAEVLVGLISSTELRMRRDYKQLLTAIQAVALLYQCQRDRTPEGWIEATLEDYAKARDLLAPIFEATAADGLTPAIRKTVEAIGAEEHNVTGAELVKRLNLSKGTVSWRVTRAIQGGWLINEESKPGHPARLRRGLPLPDETTGLPSVEQVRQAFELKQGSISQSNGQGSAFRPKTRTERGTVRVFE